MCTSGCATQDHASYAECLRSKSPRIAYTNTAGGWDFTKQQRWDRELGRYRDLVASGVDPQGTTHREMDQAERLAEAF